jgi:hypothetical protein
MTSKTVTTKGVTGRTRESQTLVLVASAGAGRRWLGSGQAVRCHYSGAYLATARAAMRKT